MGIVINKKLATWCEEQSYTNLRESDACPHDIKIIQVYVPTLDKEEEEAEDLYYTINFRAEFGEGKTPESVGPLRLGERNKRGYEPEIFANTNVLIVANT